MLDPLGQVAAAEGRVGKTRKERWGRGGRVVWSFEIRVGGDFGVWEGKVVRCKFQ